MTNRIDHTGHDHPRTPEARRACRAALRTMVPATGDAYSRDYPQLERVLAADAVGRTVVGKAEFVKGEPDIRFMKPFVCNACEFVNGSWSRMTDATGQVTTYVGMSVWVVRG